MVYGRTPFSELSLIQKLHCITDPTYEISFPPLPNPALLDVLKSCLQRKPELRAPIVGPNGLLQHPFLHPNSSPAPAPAPAAPPHPPGAGAFSMTVEQLESVIATTVAAVTAAPSIHAVRGVLEPAGAAAEAAPAPLAGVARACFAELQQQQTQSIAGPPPGAPLSLLPGLSASLAAAFSAVAAAPRVTPGAAPAAAAAAIPAPGRAASATAAPVPALSSLTARSASALERAPRAAGPSQRDLESMRGALKPVAERAIQRPVPASPGMKDLGSVLRRGLKKFKTSSPDADLTTESEFTFQ
jgi:serine/threonine-protein kinase TTK/MPS1